MELESGPPSENAELDRRYAQHLEFLWAEYNKLMYIGLLASAATLGMLIKGILLNKDVREVLAGLKEPLDSKWLVLAIVCAGISAILFIAARWCSQILMERQVYGSHEDALKYFEGTLENETILPTALKLKPYLGWIDRKSLLRLTGHFNEFSIWTGIMLLFFSWLSCVVFAWPLIATLPGPTG